MKVRSLLACFALVLSSLHLPAIAQSVSLVPTKWASSHYVNHPLVGQIYQANGKQISEDFLLKQAGQTRFVLLGEIHDNPDHHKIQANIISAIANQQRRPSIVFEMVPRRLAAQLGNFDLVNDPQLNEFAKRLEWEKRGWFSWDIYRPIALAAATNDLPMVAGNLDRTTTRKISKEGMSALDEAEQVTFGLDTSLPQILEEQLNEELRQSHCNLIPEKMLPSMVTVQRAKDGSMADAMIQADNEFGSVLIAGNGHIRKDLGVPFALRHRLGGSRGDSGKNDNQATGSNNLAIALVEVSSDLSKFADYALNSSTGEPLYDIVIFTPKFDTTDHCALMRAQFKKMKKNKP